MPEAVWNFHIGGYQVCEKWIKDRWGRTLTKDDITHYQKIVVALNETIRLMKEVDDDIEQYGGWPGAFRSASQIAVAPAALPRSKTQPHVIPFDDGRVKDAAYRTLLPLYTLKAAAGYFGNGENVEPEGWLEATDVGALDERMFVARAMGRSMEPTIHDGDLLVFRRDPSGTRQGKIVLAQYRGAADQETGGAFTVKRYSSEKVVDGEGVWRHTRITLSPLNADFGPIVIPEDRADDFRILAEFVAVLGQ